MELEFLFGALKSLSDNGLYTPDILEDLFAKVLSISSGRKVQSVNGLFGANFPGIDLISDDLKTGYQATLIVGSAKKKATINGVSYEFSHQNRAPDLVDVYVVGLKLTSTAGLRSWSTASGKAIPRFRAAKIGELLELDTLSDELLHEILFAIRDASRYSGYLPDGVDQEAMIIVNWLDRPAVRDLGQWELDWSHCLDAFREIRLVLSTGRDFVNVPVCAPMTWFPYPLNASLRKIYRSTEKITRILGPIVQNGLHPDTQEISEIDASRIGIQEAVDEFCSIAGVPQVIW